MLITDILQSDEMCVSFEFFPPKTEAGWERLFKSIANLTPLNPSFVSVTYGAGGTTRSRTHQLVTRLIKETDLTVLAHLTCRGSRKEEIHDILERYARNGVNNILALRGDPRDEEADAPRDFQYAIDLVDYIKKHFPRFSVGVACYPEGHPDTPNRLKEMDHLKAKVDAGADYMITQMFFDDHEFYDFRERCEIAGIHMPVIAGIMPITSIKGMHRMAELSGGTRFPSGLLRAVQRAQGDEYVKHVGVHWAAEQIRDLIDNKVAGIHLYTLNHSDASMRICETLGLSDFGTVIRPGGKALQNGASGKLTK
ncbi:MAG TPA: methylenetetrahydrofolate reductase [NAD(P)H] [bacterium]|nr:methylenetetrahydrofolate reductase [NAD(P)H] [bacterium]